MSLYDENRAAQTGLEPTHFNLNADVDSRPIWYFSGSSVGDEQLSVAMNRAAIQIEQAGGTIVREHVSCLANASNRDRVTWLIVYRSVRRIDIRTY